MQPIRVCPAAAAIAAVLILLVGATRAGAQPFAYVIGQRDDPAPGNSGVQVLSVINTANNTKVATIPLELSCLCVYNESVAVLPNGSRVYVANPGSASISVIDTATNSVVGRIAVGDTAATVEVSPDGTKLLVLDGYPSFNLSIYDTATHAKVGSIPVGAVQAFGMAVAPDGKRVYVSTYGGNSVKVIDLTSNTITATIPVGELPLGVDITPDGQYVYVGNYLGNTLAIISTATNTVVTTLNMGTTTSGSRINNAGTKAYVTAAPIRIVDPQTRTVVGTVSGVGAARALEFTPDDQRAYFATSAGVFVVSTATNSSVGLISFNSATEGSASSIAIAPPPIPEPPTELEVVSVVGNVVTLQWVPPATGAAPTHYALEGGTSPGQVLASIPTGRATPTFTFTAPSGSFYVRMVSLSGAARSSRASNEVRVNVNVPTAPSPPRDLLGSANGAALQLTWKNTFDGGGPSTVVLDVSGTTTTSIPLGLADSFSFGAVPPGTYTLSVRATNATGSSVASNAITLTFPGSCAGSPLTPARFVAFAVANTVFLRWDAPATGPAPSHYVVNVSGAISLSVPTVARSLSGGAGQGTYGFNVAAVNACGTGPATDTRLVTMP